MPQDQMAKSLENDSLNKELEYFKTTLETALKAKQYDDFIENLYQFKFDCPNFFKEIVANIVVQSKNIDWLVDELVKNSPLKVRDTTKSTIERDVYVLYLETLTDLTIDLEASFDHEKKLQILWEAIKNANTTKTLDSFLLFFNALKQVDNDFYHEKLMQLLPSDKCDWIFEITEPTLPTLFNDLLNDYAIEAIKSAGNREDRDMCSVLSDVESESDDEETSPIPSRIKELCIRNPVLRSIIMDYSIRYSGPNLFFEFLDFFASSGTVNIPEFFKKAETTSSTLIKEYIKSYRENLIQQFRNFYNSDNASINRIKDVWTRLSQFPENRIETIGNLVRANPDHFFKFLNIAIPRHTELASEIVGALFLDTNLANELLGQALRRDSSLKLLNNLASCCSGEAKLLELKDTVSFSYTGDGTYGTVPSQMIIEAKKGDFLKLEKGEAFLCREGSEYCLKQASRIKEIERRPLSRISFKRLHPQIHAAPPHDAKRPCSRKGADHKKGKDRQRASGIKETQQPPSRRSFIRPDSQSLFKPIQCSHNDVSQNNEFTDNEEARLTKQ